MKKHILLFCNNGYVVEEVFLPIVYGLKDDFIVDIMMEDFYVHPRVHEKIGSLQSIGVIGELIYLSCHKKRKQSVLLFLKNLKDVFSEYFNKYSVAAVVLTVDFRLMDRYLIDLAKKYGAKTFVVQTGTLIRVLDIFHHQRGLSYEEKLFTQKRTVISTSFIKKIQNKVIRLMVPFQQFIEYQVASRFVLGKSFSPPKQSHCSFVSGNVDEVLMYDRQEKMALENIVDTPLSIHLIHHPARFYAKKNESQHKLLVIFAGCIHEEMLSKKINKWVELITQVCLLRHIEQVDLRVHPRMDAALKWPNKLMHQLEQKNIYATIVDAFKVSLLDTIHDYAVVIGAPSGALRVIREVTDVPIMVAPNLGDPPPYEESWILGDAEGLEWIRTKEDVVSVIEEKKEFLRNDFPSAESVIKKLA